MVVTRLIGKIALSGSARKQVSQALYKEYTHAARQLEKSGALNGVQAELKLKAKNGFFGQSTNDYIQLAYKDAKGRTQKLALDKRNASEEGVKDYLEGAIAKAKSVTAESVKAGMAKSKKYDQYTAALKNNEALFDNLPQKASVEFKRSPITGHKKAVISIPVSGEKGRTTYLTQSIKKGRGKDIGDFVKDTTEHANLVFENAVNPRGLFSTRQIRDEIKNVTTANTRNGAKGLKGEWQNAIGEVNYFSSHLPKSDEAYGKVLERVQKSYDKVGKRVSRQEKFNYINREFDNNLNIQLAASPSRNKSSINLATEKQKAINAYGQMQQGLNGKYQPQFQTKLDKGIQGFKEAKQIAQTKENKAKVMTELKHKQVMKELTEQAQQQPAESGGLLAGLRNLFDSING